MLIGASSSCEVPQMSGFDARALVGVTEEGAGDFAPEADGSFGLGRGEQRGVEVPGEDRQRLFKVPELDAHGHRLKQRPDSSTGK